MPPDVPRIVLVDTFRDEAEEALRVAHALGERLYGIRLDTPAERGRVTPELVLEVRARLDQAGFEHVKIIVSGGLSPDRIAIFKDAGAPVDSYAVGSYIAVPRRSTSPATSRRSMAVPIAKRGRIPGLTASPRSSRSSWPSGVLTGSRTVLVPRGSIGAMTSDERDQGHDDPEPDGEPALDETARRLDELAERETAYGLLQRGKQLLPGATTRRRRCCSSAPRDSSRARARSSRRSPAPTTTAASMARRRCVRRAAAHRPECATTGALRPGSGALAGRPA
jgi:hypothetical protein